MKDSILTRTSGKNLTFTELKDKLNEVRNARYALIVPSEDLKVHMPAVITTPSMPEAITATGVGVPVMDWQLTPHAFRQWCSKFNVPTKYLANLADWGESLPYQQLSMEIMNTHHKEAAKPLLIRGLRSPENPDDQYCRAVLSPNYNIIENYDILTAVFEGLRIVRDEHDISFTSGPAHVSDTSLRARINLPQLSTISEALLKDYKSPFSGETGLDNPTVFMGIEIRNSEVGAGAFTLAPIVVIEVCNNGMTLTSDIYRKVHLGSTMEHGKVSSRTMAATMELITTETIDKIVDIAHPDFIAAKVRELEGLKEPVQPSVVSDYLGTAFADDSASGIFDIFVSSGDISAFGVAQAITAYSQADSVSLDDALMLDDGAIDHAVALAAV